MLVSRRPKRQCQRRRPYIVVVAVYVLVSHFGHSFAGLSLTSGGAESAGHEKMHRDVASYIYTVSQKKVPPYPLSVLDRFAKFFHCCKEQ